MGRVVGGRYRVGERLGSGGMGTVYAARHVELDREVAIKVLPSTALGNPTSVERFLREARVVSRLAHPNIVGVTDFGQLPDGALYFVMERVRGLTLGALIDAEAPMRPARVVQIARQIALALGAAHASGVVHRDVKPDNVLIEGDGPETRARVVDFGVAKIVDARQRLTRTGVVCGTPLYLSPEQAGGRPVDARSDVYALGVVMYEMVTGVTPFQSTGDVIELIHAHLSATPPPVAAHRLPHALGGLEAVVDRALAKDPADRFESMDALVRALDALGHEPARPRPFERPRAVDEHATTDPEVRAASPPPGPSAKTILSLSIAIGLVGVVLLLLAMDRATPAPGARPPAQAAPAPSAEVAPPGPVAASRVRIESTPSGAEIHIGGAMIGNTPGWVRRPAQGEVRLELRLPGHTPQAVVVSATTSERLTAHLSPLAPEPSDQVPPAAPPRVAAPDGPPPSVRPPPSPEPPPEPPPAADPPPAAELPSIPLPPGVLDPWR